MRRLGSSEVLSAWEESRHRSSTHRALSILSRALPDSSPDELARLPLGRRASLLLQQHSPDSGSTLDGICTCPECDAQVSIAVETAELMRRSEDSELSKDVEIEGHRFHLRPPNSDDLLAISGLDTAAEARETLLKRCVRPDCDDLSIDDWPISQLERCIEECDPLAEVVLEARCPDCGAAWQVDFDVVDFIWEELTGRARRLLFTIDALARAYGWNEPEILALSPARRAWYVDMVS